MRISKGRIALGVYLILVLFVGRLVMEEGRMANRDFTREREWPVILKVAREYDLSQEQTLMLLAMREAENGPPGHEFGVMPAKGTDLETQAKWAAGSIKANTERYNILRQTGTYQGSRRSIGLSPATGTPFPQDSDFVEFMGYYGGPTGYGWTPIHAPEMKEEEREQHKNWVPNVRRITEQLRKEFKEKGAYNVEP